MDRGRVERERTLGIGIVSIEKRLCLDFEQSTGNI